MNKKWTWKRAAVSIAVPGMLCIAAVCVRNSGGIPAETIQVRKEAFLDTCTEDGVIRTGEICRVLSKVSGSVQEIYVKENMPVEKGDLLMRVDARDLVYEKELHASALNGYRAQLDQSRINQLMISSPREYLEALSQELAVAQAEYQAAETNWKAGQALYESGVMSKSDMEQAKSAYEQSKSAREKAESRIAESKSKWEELKNQGLTDEDINSRFYESADNQLKAMMQSEQSKISQLEDKIADCEIRAGDDGVITAFPAKELSMIQEGQEIAVINGTGTGFVVESEVLTTVEPYLHIGDPVDVTRKLHGQDIAYTGTIREIYDFASESTSALGLKEYRIMVKAELDWPESENQEYGGLKDGSGVEVEYTLYRAEDALVIPSGALFRFDGKDYVYRVAEGRAVRTEVTVAYQSGISAVIEAGLTEQERIVKNVDAEELYDGAKIRD